VTVRGTQSFVQVLGECRRKPSLLLLEIAWRWAFGIPLLLLLGYEGWRIYTLTAQAMTGSGLDQLTLMDPEQAAAITSNIYAVLTPPVAHLLYWLLPLAAIGWAIASGVGRNVVLRRYDAALPWRPVRMAVLQLLRVVFLVGSFWFWFAAIQWDARFALTGEEPNIVLYCALVICLSLGVFTVWALVSWVFSIAPLLALLEDLGVGASLKRSLRLGPLAGKLVEINLVLGIVKLGLIVLAMVFSAIPLPFEAVVQGTGLYAWWALGAVLYLIASDFFQVARLVAFVDLWRVYTPAGR
jgi:hypothetical protein